MSVIHYGNIEILGMACAVPEEKRKSQDYSLASEEINVFISKVGVIEHPVATEKQTASDLCVIAAKKLISELKYTAETIDMIIFITQTGDYVKPATSHVIHKRLGCNKDCMCFDVNLGCSGYVYGLSIASAHISSGAAKNVLLLTGERDFWSAGQSIKDLMLFAPAGSATLIGKGQGNIKALLKADGNRYKAILNVGNGARSSSCGTDSLSIMDGEAVFSFTISEIPRIFKEFFISTKTSMDDYNYCVLHQANEMILRYIQKKLKISNEKLPISIDRFGNTSSASIPLTICDALGNKEEQDEIKIVASGFGVGLSWGIVSFSINKKLILPIIYSDEVYEEKR